MARQPTSSTQDFAVAIEQENAPIAMPTAVINDRAAAPLDLKFAVSITNRTKDPVTVRHITLKYRDPGREAPRRTRNYSTTIAPGATEKFDFWLTMRSNDNDARPFTPPVLPSEIEFEGPHGKRLESFVSRVTRAAA
jgi:hypothetical protein